jgi:hypothetical protein
VVVQRKHDDFLEATRDGCVFVPLVGEEGWPC